MADSLLENYNPLYDVHLRQYFALPHMQKHLRSIGLLDSNGLPTEGRSGDSEMLARHQQMMEMMLKNREVQLHKLAEIQRKLDAAEKVEIYRRIRSGQSPESYRRAKASRSLSRGRRSANNSAKVEGERQRRFSNSTDDKELINQVEEGAVETFNPKDCYKRLSANAGRYRYLHRLDDETLAAYQEQLRRQLQRLERFREVSFGVHSVARAPPSPHISWFFRRRSLPSLTSSAPANTLHEPLRSMNSLRGRMGKSQSPKKYAETHDSRGAHPQSTRRRRSSETRLPPIKRPPPTAGPTLTSSKPVSTTKLPPVTKQPTSQKPRTTSRRRGSSGRSGPVRVIKSATTTSNAGAAVAATIPALAITGAAAVLASRNNNNNEIEFLSKDEEEMPTIETTEHHEDENGNPSPIASPEYEPTENEKEEQAEEIRAEVEPEVEVESEAEFEPKTDHDELEAEAELTKDDVEELFEIQHVDFSKKEPEDESNAEGEHVPEGEQESERHEEEYVEEAFHEERQEEKASEEAHDEVQKEHPEESEEQPSLSEQVADVPGEAVQEVAEALSFHPHGESTEHDEEKAETNQSTPLEMHEQPEEHAEELLEHEESAHESEHEEIISNEPHEEIRDDVVEVAHIEDAHVALEGVDDNESSGEERNEMEEEERRVYEASPEPEEVHEESDEHVKEEEPDIDTHNVTEREVEEFNEHAEIHDAPSHEQMVESLEQHEDEQPYEEEAIEETDEVQPHKETSYDETGEPATDIEEEPAVIYHHTTLEAAVESAVHDDEVSAEADFHEEVTAEGEADEEAQRDPEPVIEEDKPDFPAPQPAVEESTEEHKPSLFENAIDVVEAAVDLVKGDEEEQTDGGEHHSSLFEKATDLAQKSVDLVTTAREDKEEGDGGESSPSILDQVVGAASETVAFVAAGLKAHDGSQDSLAVHDDAPTQQTSDDVPAALSPDQPADDADKSGEGDHSSLKSDTADGLQDGANAAADVLQSYEGSTDSLIIHDEALVEPIAEAFTGEEEKLAENEDYNPELDSQEAPAEVPEDKQKSPVDHEDKSNEEPVAPSPDQSTSENEEATAEEVVEEIFEKKIVQLDNETSDEVAHNEEPALGESQDEEKENEKPETPEVVESFLEEDVHPEDDHPSEVPTEEAHDETTIAAEEEISGLESHAFDPEREQPSPQESEKQSQDGGVVSEQDEDTAGEGSSTNAEGSLNGVASGEDTDADPKTPVLTKKVGESEDEGIQESVGLED